MVRQILLSVTAALAVCAGYTVTGPLAGLVRAKSENTLPEIFFKDAKTDFISVAVFEGLKVRGYVSFRLALSISDPARVPEIGYMASDIAIREKLSISDLDSSPAGLSKRFEQRIKTQTDGKLPANMIASLRVIDFGFDARI